MKKWLTVGMALAAAYLLAGQGGWPGSSEGTAPSPADRTGAVTRPREPRTVPDDRTLLRAFERHESGIQVESAGEVSRVLADDNDGSRHQRIILRLPWGQTLLIAHNIDLAPRVEGLRAGDLVAFSGEYEWNPKGGVVHWTHRDPAGQHVAGWLEVGGRRYQ